jgi:hypothetical protein
LFEPLKHCLGPSNIVWTEKTMFEPTKQCSTGFQGDSGFFLG